MDTKFFIHFWKMWIVWLTFSCSVCFAVCYWLPSLTHVGDPLYSGIGGAIGIFIPTVLLGLFYSIRGKS